jgi:hypothetical protein
MKKGEIMYDNSAMIINFYKEQGVLQSKAKLSNTPSKESELFS